MRAPATFSSPEPPTLNMARIAAAAGLTFTEAQQVRLREAVEHFFTWSCPAAVEPVPTKKVKEALASLAKACNRLAPMIAAFAQGETSDGQEDGSLSARAVAVGLAVRGLPGEVGWIDPGLLAHFLTEMAEQARVQAERRHREGHPFSGDELRRLLLAVHPLYLEAGGQGLGCWAGAYAPGSKSKVIKAYVGPLLDMLVEILEQCGVPFMREGLGATICEGPVKWRQATANRIQNDVGKNFDS